MSIDLGTPPSSAQMDDLKASARQIKTLTSAIAKDNKETSQLLADSAQDMADATSQTVTNFFKELEFGLKLMLFGSVDPSAKELT